MEHAANKKYIYINTFIHTYIHTHINLHIHTYILLYLRELEVGSYRRPSEDLVDGSIRTLKK
jgi:hypothetical protein